MANPTRIEVNCETGETLEVELTDAEVAEMAAQAELAAQAQAERDAEAKAAADVKASAISKLAKLGLSDAEIAALVG